MMAAPDCISSPSLPHRVQNDTVIKGEFPISRVEVVEMMAFDVFHKDNVIQVFTLG